MNVLADYSESGEYESILDSSDLVPLGTSETTVSTSEGSASVQNLRMINFLLAWL